MQTSPSPTEHDSATQFDPESYSLLKAFVVALILFVLSQYSLRWLPPVTLWLLWRLYREGGFRDARRIAMALWPVAIPTAVFLGYHTLKWRLTGHFLVSPEFQDANLGRVSGPLQYLERMWHSVNQLTGFHNPCFWMLIMTAVLTLVIAIRLREPDFAGRLRSALRVVQPARDPARFFRATSVGETAVLAWLMALAHLGFWSLRQYLELVDELGDLSTRQFPAGIKPRPGHAATWLSTICRS